MHESESPVINWKYWQNCYLSGASDRFKNLNCTRSYVNYKDLIEDHYGYYR
jgi:hypothetical protein